MGQTTIRTKRDRFCMRLSRRLFRLRSAYCFADDKKFPSTEVTFFATFFDDVMALLDSASQETQVHMCSLVCDHLCRHDLKRVIAGEDAWRAEYARDVEAKKRQRRLMERVSIDITHRPGTGIVYHELGDLLKGMM